MLRESTSFRIIKTPSSSKSFSRTRQKTSPTHKNNDSKNKQTHMQLAQTTSRLKQPTLIRNKFQTLPGISSLSSSNKIQLELMVEELREENKLIRAQNKLLEGEISMMRVLSESEGGEKEGIILKRLVDSEHRSSLEIMRLMKEIESQKGLIAILKQNSLKLVGDKERVGEVLEELESLSRIKRDNSHPVQNPNSTLYLSIIDSKYIQISKLSATVLHLTQILRQINHLINTTDDNQFSLIPQKLNYLINFKASEKNQEIEALEIHKGALEKELVRKDKEMEDMKLEFAENAQEISNQLHSIIENMKREFDALKMENWILTTENKELAGKYSLKETARSGANEERVSHKKVEKVEMDSKEVSKLPSPSNHSNLIGLNPNSMAFKATRLKSFSHWIYEWSHSFSDTDRITLLRLLLQRKQLLKQGVQKCMSQLSNLVYASFVTGNNIQLRLTCIELIRECIDDKILQEHNLYLEKILPVIVEQIKDRTEDVILIIYHSIREGRGKKVVEEAVVKNKVFQDFRELLGESRLKEEILTILSLLTFDKEIVMEFVEEEMDEELLYLLDEEEEGVESVEMILSTLHSLLVHPAYIQVVSSTKPGQQSVLESYRVILKLIHTQHNKLSLKCALLLIRIPHFVALIDKPSLVTSIITNVQKFPDSQLILDIVFKQASQLESLLPAFFPLIPSLHTLQPLLIIFKLTQIVRKNTQEFDKRCIGRILELLEDYPTIEEENVCVLSKMVRIAIERNKEVVTQALSPDCSYIITLYLQSKTSNLILISLLQLLIQLKKPEIDAHKPKLIPKLIEDSTNKQLKVRIISLRSLILFSKSQEFKTLFTIQHTLKIFSNLKSLKDQQCVSLSLSLIYFLSSIPQHSDKLLSQFMGTIIPVIRQFSSSKSILLKSLTLIEKIHLQHYTSFITNQLVKQPSLPVFSVINRFLLHSQNKKQMSNHALFLFKSLNNPIPIQLLANSICQSKDCDSILKEMHDLGKEYSFEGNKMGGVVKEILTEMGRFNKRINKEVERLEKSASE